MGSFRLGLNMGVIDLERQGHFRLKSINCPSKCIQTVEMLLRGTMVRVPTVRDIGRLNCNLIKTDFKVILDLNR